MRETNKQLFAHLEVLCGVDTVGVANCISPGLPGEAGDVDVLLQAGVEQSAAVRLGRHLILVGGRTGQQGREHKGVHAVSGALRSTLEHGAVRFECEVPDVLARPVDGVHCLLWHKRRPPWHPSAPLPRPRCRRHPRCIPEQPCRPGPAALPRPGPAPPTAPRCPPRTRCGGCRRSSARRPAPAARRCSAGTRIHQVCCSSAYRMWQNPKGRYDV